MTGATGLTAHPVMIGLLFLFCAAAAAGTFVMARDTLVGMYPGIGAAVRASQSSLGGRSHEVLVQAFLRVAPRSALISAALIARTCSRSQLSTARSGGRSRITSLSLAY